MSRYKSHNAPFILHISFHKYLEYLQEIAENDSIPFRAEYARAVLQKANEVPELSQGFTDLQIIEKHQQLIKLILSDIFPTALSHNEIKAVSLPFHNITFNYTKRFQQILTDAKTDFNFDIREIDGDDFYIFNCMLILQKYYNQQLKSSYPIHYDIPDKEGIMRHYKITINADFIEAVPTDKSIILSASEIDELLENYDNIQLWKEKIPEFSWILKGFCIITLTDVTSDFSISEMKSLVLSANPEEGMEGSLEPFFQSYFEISDLRTGFMIFDEDSNQLQKLPHKELFSSFILENIYDNIDTKTIGKEVFDSLVERNKPFVISDVNQYLSLPKFKAFKEYFNHNNTNSFILIPVVYENKLLAILEMASSQKRAFNILKLKKLEFITPFLLYSMSRFHHEIKNKLQAIIQKEYTSLHPSVEWRFLEEAKKMFFNHLGGEAYSPKEVIFKNVYPLYAQCDIKSSSIHRNQAQQQDLIEQSENLISIFEKINTLNLIQEKILLQLKVFLQEIKHEIKVDTEQRFIKLVDEEIHPILKNYCNDCNLNQDINLYFSSLSFDGKLLYKRRKDYDHTVLAINTQLSNLLEERQLDAQQIFPHYFKLFKTDGVAHDIYIGSSISPKQPFTYETIKQIRLWQLKVTCEMERWHHQHKTKYPFPLEINSLVLVHNVKISIRFRMDEKNFDIDGAYNSKYEVIKKRIDKAFIKNTTERITQPQHLVIVYATDEDGAEYLEYIRELQKEGWLQPHEENFNVEDLQGISGLKAWRIALQY